MPAPGDDLHPARRRAPPRPVPTRWSSGSVADRRRRPSTARAGRRRTWPRPTAASCGRCWPRLGVTGKAGEVTKVPTVPARSRRRCSCSSGSGSVGRATSATSRCAAAAGAAARARQPTQRRSRSPCPPTSAELVSGRRRGLPPGRLHVHDVQDGGRRRRRSGPAPSSVLSRRRPASRRRRAPSRRPQVVARGRRATPATGSTCPPPTCVPAGLRRRGRDAGQTLDRAPRSRVKVLRREGPRPSSAAAASSASAGARSAPPRLVELTLRPARRRSRTSPWSARASPSTPAACASSPPPAWTTMKCDMAGAAAVVAGDVRHRRARAAGQGHRLRADGREHAVRHGASGPATSLTMYGGTTVEVLNTDAEGRLVLGRRARAGHRGASPT